jgi:ParB family chromosome partitioning protein
MAKTKKPRLGRGLSSLISKPVSVAPPPPESSAQAEQSNSSARSPQPAPSSQPESGLTWVALDQIEANPYQPRRTFNDQDLAQLASTIKQDGLMQPIVLRRMGSGYQIVAGERRWRASKIAELSSVPALVRELDDQQMAEWAVIENLQRKDLNAVERAAAFGRLVDRFGLSHQQVADRIGSDRTTVTNTIRLLDLDVEVQEMIRLGKLSGGHGRALLALNDAKAQQIMSRQAMDQGWSVRKIEQAVRDAIQPSDAARKRQAQTSHVTDLEKQVGVQLGTKVRIKRGSKKGAGSLMIEFYDLDQFDALLDRMGVRVE